MVVLDTDHMSLLEWADGRDSTPSRTRLAALSPAAAPFRSADRRSIPQNQRRGARLSFSQRKSAICGRCSKGGSRRNRPNIAHVPYSGDNAWSPNLNVG